MTLIDCVNQAALELGWPPDKVEDYCRHALTLLPDVNCIVPAGQEETYLGWARTALQSEDAVARGQEIIQRVPSSN